MAIDGKSAPLHRPGGADDARMFLAAVAHGCGGVAGQIASDSAGGEILGARRLVRELDIRELDVAGCVLTLDALHSGPNSMVRDYPIALSGQQRRSMLNFVQSGKTEQDFLIEAVAKGLQNHAGFELSERG